MAPTVLITGGSGFLGRALARRLKTRATVVLGSRNNAQNLAAEKATGCRAVPLDVARIESVRDLISELEPDAVIHAAATKFVDLSEREPMECVDVNVLGSQNVARVCHEKGVRVLIGVSTDKAAPPAGNLYGLSKALMERMFCGIDAKGPTRVTCVRMGNIAWSTGSVFPIWKRMIDDSGVILSTGPDMRRFFLTVDDAAALVVRSLDNISTLAGKVCVMPMKAAQIRDVLDVWTKHGGGAWKPTERRPGDKADEHLVGETEVAHATDVMIDGIPHCVIDFANKAAHPIRRALSTADAPRFTEAEIVRILQAPVDLP